MLGCILVAGCQSNKSLLRKFWKLWWRPTQESTLSGIRIYLTWIYVLCERSLNMAWYDCYTQGSHRIFGKSRHAVIYLSWVSPGVITKMQRHLLFLRSQTIPEYGDWIGTHLYKLPIYLSLSCSPQLIKAARWDSFCFASLQRGCSNGFIGLIHGPRIDVYLSCGTKVPWGPGNVTILDLVGPPLDGLRRRYHGVIP